jgi:ribonuclease Z
MRFELTILGSGSALPTSNRNTTAQVLNVLERFFLIDCGEGTQHQLRKYKISFNQIGHILISHLHGDHFFGLFGLISTMSLIGRDRPLHIYGPADLQDVLSTVLRPQFEKPPFPLIFHELMEDKPSVVFEDKVITVTSFPLKHSVDVWGFKFEEKPRQRKIIGEKIDQFNISIPEINGIKDGENLERDGIIIPNKDLTTDPLEPRSYAFMTDTLLTRRYLELFKGVQLLYHEATFLHEDLGLARKTLHTTAKQAALLAEQAEVQKLLLGHFSTRYKSDSLFLEEAQEAFSETYLACDGDKIIWPDHKNNHFIFNDKPL